MNRSSERIEGITLRHIIARAHRAAIVLGLGLLLALMLSKSAAAYTSILPPFTGASDFITGFPTCPDIITGEPLGPLGLLFDGAHFFADDTCNGFTYRFTAAGGSASTPDLQLQNLLTHDLTLKGGVYYGDTFFPSPALFKFDPTTLAVTLVTTFPLTDSLKLALGVAGDPLSSDLYVSTTSGLFRVQGPNSGSPVLTNLGGFFDGIAFTADGSRFYGASGNFVFGFNRTTSLPGFPVDTGHPADGIAVALNNTTLSGVNVSNNVFVNNNDGTLVRIDVNNGNAVSVVASGGSRGDFTTVGPDNCLYVTQSDRIEKMSPCFFQVTIANKCPLGQGSWKKGGAWPVTSLTLGSQSYTKAQLLVILKAPAGGDASLILADALIATKLSIAGDSNPGPIGATVSDSDSLLAAQAGRLPYGIKPSTTTGNAMVNDADILTSYNGGTLTASCTP